MFLKISILFIGILFAGCSQKIANTWQSKIVTNRVNQDIPLYVDIKGKGKPVVLLHGFGASHITFKYIIPKLSKHFKTYAFDLKGFGNSPKVQDGCYSVYDQAVILEKYFLKHHLNKIILIGHSYGGGVALVLALMHPEMIDKLVLIDSASYDQQLPKLLRWLQIPILGKVGFFIIPSSVEVKESYKYAFYDDNKIPEDIVKEYAKNMYLPGAKSAYCMASELLIPKDINKISKEYKKIKIPTLIIWGDNDIVIRKDKAYKLHKDIKNSQLHIIPQCGHIPQEEKPVQTLKILEKFMLQ